MTPDDFILKYQAALGTQLWTNVEPLIWDSASVTFSDGSVHFGKIEIQSAFEQNFRSIKSEKYSIENVKWIRREEFFAVYLFEYHWAGLINDKHVSGSGVGTSVLKSDKGEWKLLAEHLARKTK